MTTVSESFKTYSRDAKVPVVRDGKPNPAAYRQVSAGSILGECRSVLTRGEISLASSHLADNYRVLGLFGGVALSTFSKTFAFLFGLLVFGVQVRGVECW